MVLPVCESSVCRRSRAVGSVRGEPQVLTREPQTPPRSIQQSFPRCFKSKNKKDKTKKQQWCTEKRAQSQGNLCECSKFLFLLQKKKKKKTMGKKGVGKAGSQESGTGGKKRKILQREQVGQCSCSLVLCVFLSCVHLLSCQRVHLEHVCFVCVCEYIWVILRVGRDVRACVSTAGRRGGSTAGRRCALQSASSPGTGG